MTGYNEVFDVISDLFGIEDLRVRGEFESAVLKGMESWLIDEEPISPEAWDKAVDIWGKCGRRRELEKLLGLQPFIPIAVIEKAEKYLEKMKK